MYEDNRDVNAAQNILSRRLSKVGVDHSESTSVETGVPTSIVSVDANAVLEPGSSILKDGEDVT